MRDYPTLIEAWKMVKYNNVRLKIIGVDHISGVNRVPKNVDFIKRVTILELKENIAKARFVVVPLPYYKYSYGQMSFLQSMALGKICIVTKTPSSQDYINDCENGFLVQPYDINDLARKINLLLQKNSICNEIEKNARKSIENKFNEKYMATQLSEFILSII